MLNSSKDFRNGRIYRILNHIDDECYVGSTTQALSKRMVEHRGQVYCNRTRNIPLYIKMLKEGVENFYIELIEEYPCDNLEQLRKREGHYIREMGTLNKVIAGRTKSEYVKDNKEKIKEYCTNNKEKRAEWKKTYNAQNKEKQAMQKQEWHKQNKEVRAAKLKATYTCSCGSVITVGWKTRHERTDKHRAFRDALEVPIPLSI